MMPWNKRPPHSHEHQHPQGGCGCGASCPCAHGADSDTIAAAAAAAAAAAVAGSQPPPAAPTWRVLVPKWLVALGVMLIGVGVLFGGIAHLAEHKDGKRGKGDHAMAAYKKGLAEGKGNAWGGKGWGKRGDGTRGEGNMSGLSRGEHGTWRSAPHGSGAGVLGHGAEHSMHGHADWMEHHMLEQSGDAGDQKG